MFISSLLHASPHPSAQPACSFHQPHVTTGQQNHPPTQRGCSQINKMYFIFAIRVPARKAVSLGSSEGAGFGLKFPTDFRKKNPEGTFFFFQKHGDHRCSSPAHQPPSHIKLMENQLTWPIKGPVQPINLPKPFLPHCRACPMLCACKPRRGGASAAGGVQASAANFVSVSKSWQESGAAVRGQNPCVPPAQPVLSRGNVPIYFPEAGCAAARTQWQVPSCHGDGDFLRSPQAVNLLVWGKASGTTMPHREATVSSCHVHPPTAAASLPARSEPKAQTQQLPWTTADPLAQPSRDPSEDAESPAPIPPHLGT